MGSNGGQLMSKFKHFLGLVLLGLSTQAKAEVLWDNWYTVTDNGHPDSYYNEKAELVGDKAKIQVNTWIKDGQKVHSEVLGEVAKNTQLLEPLFYNFQSQTLAGEPIVIDGSVVDKGKTFTVKKRTGAEAAKSLRAQMLPKLILSSFFPLWINKNYKRINGVQPIEFQAIVEDQVDTEVPVAQGTAYEMREDDFAKSTHTRKLRIEFNKIVAIWWVTSKGDALKIEAHELERVVKKTDRKTAENFFSAP
jgi:hypothetical protein